MKAIFSIGLLGFALVAFGEESAKLSEVEVLKPIEKDGLKVSSGVSGVNEESVSGTGQFRVVGSSAQQRGVVAQMADQAKQDFLKLIAEKDQWKIPVHVYLHGKEGDPLPRKDMVMRLIEVEGAKELRVDMHVGRGLESERFRRVVLTMVLYERALRVGVTPEDGMQVSPWMVEGLCEAIAWRQDRVNRRLYASLFRQGGLFKMEQLLSLDEEEYELMDAASRAAFRVSSGALVMALLGQAAGVAPLRDFLTEAPRYQGEAPQLLRKYFSGMNLSETSLEKWWSLQMAQAGGLNVVTDVMSVHQTEAALAEALLIYMKKDEGLVEAESLMDWERLAARPELERVKAVQMAEDALVRLSYRCYPSYRSLLISYQQVLTSLAQGKTKDVAAKLASLESERETMVARASRGRDYLDWFEITRARETSGEFEDYLRLKERLKANPHRRKDSISQYLDRMDQVFHREP